jgi:hypothetical protein
MIYIISFWIFITVAAYQAIDVIWYLSQDND